MGISISTGVGISVIIPLRHDQASCARLLAELAPHRGDALEVVVVEADDSTTASALKNKADRWLMAPAGRASQLELGARSARHPCLWFLHADTQDVEASVLWLLNWCNQTKGTQGWGRFDVCFDDERPLYRMVSWFMNWRSRLSSIATGDQGIFVTSGLFDAAGGWPQQPLMEDVELSARLKRLIRPSLPHRGTALIQTSARRWRANGVWRTIFLMWQLRWRYARGEDPAALHKIYYGDYLARDNQPCMPVKPRD